MPWTQTTPTRFTRPFSTLELMYRLISSSSSSSTALLTREHFAITAVLRLHLPSSLIGDPIPFLRTAWTHLRYHHPLIAAYGIGDNYIYDVPTTEAEVSAWLDETFVVENMDADVSSVKASAPAMGEMARMHFLPGTGEVVFRSSHWRVDGIGVCWLMGRFVEVLARALRGEREVRFGDEGKNLCVGLDEAVGSITANADGIVTTDESESAMEKAATELLARYVDNLPTIGLPARLGEAARGSSRVAMKFSPTMTAAIVARCKELAISVTTAVHAAIVCATNDPRYKNPAAEGKMTTRKYTSWSTFDVRRYLPPPYNSAAYAVSTFHTGIPIVIVNPSGFLENATQLSAIYSQDLSKTPIGDDDGAGNIFTFLPRYVEKVTAVLTRPPQPDISPPTDPALSSLGVIDKYLDTRHGDDNGDEDGGDDGVEVEDFWLGVDMLTPQVMVYLWTRRGQMELSACFNEGFYEGGFVIDFLELVRGVLVEGLGVEEGEIG